MRTSVIPRKIRALDTYISPSEAHINSGDLRQKAAETLHECHGQHDDAPEEHYEGNYKDKGQYLGVV